ncbi:hypothetical protein [Vampirovibrio sp.]|uniref:hypothetical protein n=1 Tax=Vampirovibrio sp. TaxID=2717857 RepID=UPI0035948270
MPNRNHKIAHAWQTLCILALLAILPTPCWADLMHFENGKVVRGKLDRLTGDIIEFKEAGLFGSKLHIARIQLSNRHDVVETLGNKRYFGEIVYLDRFKLELKTTTGMVNLNRLKLTNIVMGAPAEQPVSGSDMMRLAPQFSTSQSAAQPMVQFPAGAEPLPGTEGSVRPSGWDDQDAIPAVNHY